MVLLCPIMNQFLMELGKFMRIVYSSKFDLSDKEMNWCVTLESRYSAQELN